ncbi:c-type cytochrome [Acidiphilium sp.]|uniref:c-type cytochrome n=1 Tax=Acidiphilium sp. TaxID=527 RepID=UPI002583F4BE|nr:cytochrome C [Acidiphilium sp.]
MVSRNSLRLRTAFVVAALTIPFAARAADTTVGEAALQQAVQKGADLFANESFGGAGTCETCHLGGGREAGKLPNGKVIPSLIGAAAVFPRYSPRAGRVITLAEQIGGCIHNALKGTPPAPGSADLVALETYITSLSKGTVMGQQFK